MSQAEFWVATTALLGGIVGLLAVLDYALERRRARRRDQVSGRRP